MWNTPRSACPRCAAGADRCAQLGPFPEPGERACAAVAVVACAGQSALAHKLGACLWHTSKKPQAPLTQACTSASSAEAAADVLQGLRTQGGANFGDCLLLDRCGLAAAAGRVQKDSAVLSTHICDDPLPYRASSVLAATLPS